MRTLKKFDRVAHGILIAGTLNAAITSFVKGGKAPNLGKQPKTISLTYYAITTAAAAYKITRFAGLQTPSERRLRKVSQMYDQAETYRKRAKLYQRAADAFLKRLSKSYKNVSSS